MLQQNYMIWLEMVLLHMDIVMHLLVVLTIIGQYGYNYNDNFIYYDQLKYIITTYGIEPAK